MSEQLCRQQYDSVEYHLEPGLGHSQVLERSAPEITTWLRARFGGTVGANSCELPALRPPSDSSAGGGRG